MSYQRERSALEISEINNLLKTGNRIPFETSLTAKRMTNHYLQTFGDIIDYSSLTEVRLNLTKREKIEHWGKNRSNFLFPGF